MVRETRHLWVGNLPDNIREDRIREHFKRYGRVQNVKLLGRTENATVGAGNSGICATVAFMDIKSASKAHNMEHVLDERTLTTEYYEPTAIPSAAGAPSAGSSPAGSGYSGSSSSVNSAPAPVPAPAPASTAPAPATVSRYHITGGEDGTGTTCPLAASAAAPAAWRGTNDSATEYCRRGNTPTAYSRYQRNNSTTPYSTPPSNVDRGTPHHRWYAAAERGAGATGGESTPSTPGGGTESGRRRRLSGSGSSRSDSTSPDPSDTSRASTPATQPAHNHNHRTQHHNQHQWAATASGRPLAICVRNLPTRSTDSSLKDGLYHEYKKHGKVVWVKVVGQNADRYAVVRFKKPSDVEKALEVSQDKLFFGCKISVAPHQSCDEDADTAKPYETDIDEYHPKATRTLFIGNLEKDVTQQQLREKFKHFGRIIEIDIKKGSSGGAGYAFCQYASISSVVEAIRAMDGEYVGGSRVKLGFGKPVATTCVWVDGLTEHTEKQVLGAVSRCGAATSVCVDRAAGAALVHFEQAAAAGAAVRELRRVAAAVSAAEPDHPRLCVDYASRECQEAFYEQLEKHGGSAALTGSDRLGSDVSTRYLPSARHDPSRYDGCASRSRASSFGRGSSRTPRYTTTDHYDPADYAADRRYRVFDEMGSSPPPEDITYEERLQSVVVSPHRARKHHRDSSSEDKKHSKERHARTTVRRSRSGSRGACSERHMARRRHRRRHDGSSSRAGTPLRDEPDTVPVEPRRPPRERPPLPMSLPLPKFAAQLLRSAPPTPRPMPTSAPDSPPRPPSVSSSSGGSAPHSPSLEERIRSLDEKYEKWSGSRALADTPDRTRLRHRLLEIDINEVKPSEVVRSLLAKRSVFDEDSERLESVVRPSSPGGSPHSRSSCSVPRTLRYPYSTTPTQLYPMLNANGPSSVLSSLDGDDEILDKPVDPRLNRPDKLVRIEKLGMFNESDYRLESRVRPRTPSTDRSQPDSSGRISPSFAKELSGESKENVERIYRDSMHMLCNDDKNLSCLDNEMKHSEENNRTCSSKSVDSNKLQASKKQIESQIPSSLENLNILYEDRKIDEADYHESDDNTARDVLDMLLKRIEQNNKYDGTGILELQIEKQKQSYNEKKSNKMNGLVEDRSVVTTDSKLEIKCQTMNDSEKNTEVLISADIDKEIKEIGIHHTHSNFIETEKNCKDFFNSVEKTVNQTSEKKILEKYNHNILEGLQCNKIEKENIGKPLDKDKLLNNTKSHMCSEKKRDSEKCSDDRSKFDREKSRHNKERLDKDRHESDKSKNTRNKHTEKSDKPKSDKDLEKNSKDKRDERDSEKTSKIYDDKTQRHDHYKKDRNEKDKKKDVVDDSAGKVRKDERHKHEKTKKDSDSKRDSKKESEFVKTRKSSRDETSRDVITRKDSTDSSASRASHDSLKVKELEGIEMKEEIKCKSRQIDICGKHDIENDFLVKSCDLKLDGTKVKIENTLDIKKEKESLDDHSKVKIEINLESTTKCKPEINEKQRHYSLDSPATDNKRKERLNSSSSLPSNIGHKRRMSSQDSFESVDDVKKNKNDINFPERRDSKESRNVDRHKTAKFSKGHFAKIIESKTKDDKKNQVKSPDDGFNNYTKELDIKEPKHYDKLTKSTKTCTKDFIEKVNIENHQEVSHNNFDFLATLELRSSEEDERQKALRKEMKEKKRIQQLQQIQQLQMQQDALQQVEFAGKLKDDRKPRSEEKKKEIAREKRMSTDRKSRDEKFENIKRRNRKVQSSDSSDSDEPKKHSIFDIIDDGPTYISMYDKVKARSCKNMQKQEEEKRQEKIKAKFCQLKQSRAKREEKKRSSWDEDSDSDLEKKKSQKFSIDNSSDDDGSTSKKHEKSHFCNLEYNVRNDEYIVTGDEEHLPNKLTRKNSRTRIMSDTSDDEISKRSISKSPYYIHEIKKECISDSDSVSLSKNNEMNVEDIDLKKNTLLNLFGKSDMDESKTKSITETHDFKRSFVKSLSNNYSSESESVISNRHISDIRKKHKKKQKKHRPLYSDDESKAENKEMSIHETENKHRNSERQRRHSNKKEKRRDKVRESVDTDENRDDKIKNMKDRKLPNNNCFDYIGENAICVKKEGKMEDIFGPLSDESDRDTKEPLIPKSESPTKISDCNSSKCEVTQQKVEQDCLIKEKEEIKRKKEKKRKEKQLFRDDDNSLDVDAVSKAIEARLFAESITDEENNVIESFPECNKKNDVILTDNPQFSASNAIDDFVKNEKLRKDCKEKRKKRKKNKEERTYRNKDHDFHNHERRDKSDHSASEKHILDSSAKTSLFELSIDLPTTYQPKIINVSDKSDDCKSLSVSPSLPRLTDSPPILNNLENVEEKHNNLNEIKSDSGLLMLSNSETIVETEVISSPILFKENHDENEMEVPLTNMSNNDIDVKSDHIKTDKFVTFGSDSSEDAVRSICNMKKDIDKIQDKPTDKNDVRVLEKNNDEKPRAMISQEETEDAVAALLGESFGGKVDNFANCYEESEDVCNHGNEIVNVSVENENIPEEDAEEMRQAVQNLNASEMEIKPNRSITPVSDNDLLLIDTDTEELEESTQDAIERLPVNIIATSQSLHAHIDQTKSAEVTSIIIAKPTTIQTVNNQVSNSNKITESESKIHVLKEENIQAKTSTATPVITSWTLSNNKILEPHLINVQTSSLITRDKSENKPQHVTANIVHIKNPQTQGVQVNNALRPIVATPRVTTPYQVINQIIRPQTTNLQPPTIKIPEPHILYQKPQGIVISPRMSSDPRLLSPKASPQGDNVTSPRLSNMAILGSTSQNLNTGGLLSPTTSIQQRSPGQVTVVRMQQPPLSPIQTVHIPHGARAMVSPNRANSVLVQAQRTPIHFNRLPVNPILAPIPKQVNLSNIIQQNKGIGVNSSIMHTQKIITTDKKKNDQRNLSENGNEPSKIILSPTSLQHSTNPTVMAQNRLISMQNAMHVGGINTGTLHINNKILINTMGQVNEKRESQILKSEQLNTVSYCSTPIIHVAGVNHSSASIIQSTAKPVVCSIQEVNSVNRSQNSNVIHSINSQRLVTPTSLGNILQTDSNNYSVNQSVLTTTSSIRPSSVLTKVELSNPITSSAVNATSMSLKIANFSEISRHHVKTDSCDFPVPCSPSVKINHSHSVEVRTEENRDRSKLFSESDSFHKNNKLEPMLDIAKGETDFEELLKDNTNEIKITNDPEKKLEVNVGKTVTLFSTNTQNVIDSLRNTDGNQKEIKHEPLDMKNPIAEKNSDDNSVQPVVVTANKDSFESKLKSENTTDIENTNNSIENNVIPNNIDAGPKTTPVETEKDSENNFVNKFEYEEKSNNSNEHSIKFDTLGNKPILSETIDNQIKSIEDNDTWNTHDFNIESVIKKVDYLCNESSEFNENPEDIKDDTRPLPKADLIVQTKIMVQPLTNMQTDNVENEVTDCSTVLEPTNDKNLTLGKRGGRSIRGKKIDKSQEKLQTRQISKTPRGMGIAKRGRGRGRVDKKIKNFVKINSNNIPGDVYDFHEDSGDETTASPSKTETRPRLILTIKSPLSGNSNMTATSTLSITQKDQNKPIDKLNKEEKNEDFISPSPNTRKSRRLQEKDVQRSSVDEIIEDVVKVSNSQVKLTKEANKKRNTRLIAVKIPLTDKTGIDVRKSTRGVKRTRDRSLSDTSVDSGDEKVLHKDHAKVPRTQEPTMAPSEEPDPPAAARTVVSNASLFQPVVPVSTIVSTTVVTSTVVVTPLAPASSTSPSIPTTTIVACPGPSCAPTPITKPPKKMITEISAKLACAFEAKQHGTGGEAQHGGEVVPGRRAPDSVPAALMPVGATEASDARVQSPALPHRPPSTPSTPSSHRPADRATPILIRNAEGEGPGAICAAGGAAGAVGVRSAYRPYVGTASLPRGAHHPPPDSSLHHHAKQVAVVGPHLRHHHPSTGTPRVTITNVPSISPQGQMSMSADFVRSPPPAHQQTSPVISVYNNGEGMYPHFSHQHYQMYQQHFRATQQDIRTSASPFSRSLEAECCEAPTPPLELRRPGSARVPRPAHSPANSVAPMQDRLIMYGASVGSGLGTGAVTGCVRSPPPAHGHGGAHAAPHVPAHVTPQGPRATSALPPVTGQGPPHASQVPREADSLQMLLTRYPVMWQGLLALKNDSAAVQMHFVGGNPRVAGDTLLRQPDHTTPLLRIAQRMRLEPAQLDQVHRKMKLENEHCILLALPCGRDHMDVLQQSTNLTAGFITYLQRKQAAGIVNIAPPGHHQAMFTVHIFPSCDFANENLNRIAPDLMHRVADIAHLLIVIATV